MAVFQNPGVLINPVALADVLRGPNGPVMRKMIVVGDRLKDTVIGNLKNGFPRDFLGPTTVKRITTDSAGIHVIVGSERLKTEPHDIYGNPLLAFEWPKVGPGIFVFAHVNHPGSDFSNPTEKHPGGYYPEVLLKSLGEVAALL